MIKAKRLVQQRVWAILACAVDIKGKEKAMDMVPIMNEFPNVFLEDLQGVSPSRTIDFG